eukprot:gene34659-42748_t
MTTDFHKGSGWNRTHIGWCWGGMTVQGLLPYYYNRVATKNRTQVLDRCYYNSMACTNQPMQLQSASFPCSSTPNVITDDSSELWRPIKEGRYSFHVVAEIPSPVNTSAIDFLKKIDKQGCWGAAQLIKLNAY